MRNLLIYLLVILSAPIFGQVDTSKITYDWPYSMPFLGKQATARGYKIQLPYGLNVNYVYNRMDLEISRFDMTIGDDPTSSINQLVGKYINLNTLNFQNTIARTNGVNVRGDVWILPFLNVYGIYSNSNGSTEVSLQPAWYDDEGNLVLSLPNMESRVDFSATSYGFGSTVIGGFNETNFFAADGNITWSQSELLDETAVFSVLSARVGERINLKNDWMLALYVGGMWRGFWGRDGNIGSVGIKEALPNLGSEILTEIDDKIAINNEIIATLDPNKPLEQIRIEALEKKNEILYNISDAFEGLLSSDVNYKIKKDIINHWSVQFGFNLEVNQNLTLRGEFGKGTGNDFVLVGVQYRFGIK